MIRCRGLLVCSDEGARNAWLAGLAAAAAHLDNPWNLGFDVAASAADAMRAILDDGDIQLVLIDSAIERVAGEGGLAAAIRAQRPELSLYGLLAPGDMPLSHEALDGYFEVGDVDYRGWFRILSAEVSEKSATPFYDQLRRYVAMAKDSWHTPGHSGGDSLKGSPWVGDFYDFVGENLLRADLSVSVSLLDSLLHPTGVIAAAQTLAAKAFGARRTYFATNGTSTSNKVIFQTLLAPGETVLLDRNCHKSVHHGVILSGARPVYLDASVNPRYGIFGPVPKATLFAAIDAHPEARALILTSCTYDGLRYDLAPIVAAAHCHGIKVIVDEAWYGFARFHPAFRPTALEAGADYVTQSTHKVLSAFSQASMIHVNDPGFDEDLFRENFNMHASTSPQYALIASLDVARKQATMEGYRLLARTLRLADEMRARINSTGVFRVLELEDLVSDEVRGDGILLDPTKLTVDIAGSGFSAEALQQLLFERFNIQVEKTTYSTITLLFTLGSTPGKMLRLYDAMARLAREARPVRVGARPPELPRFTRLACLPRDAFYEGGERLPLLDDEGRPNGALLERVCCDSIVPYPPGIPVLVPGQQIDMSIVLYLARLLRTQKSIEVHGLALVDGEYYVRVLAADELERLPGVE